MEVWMKPAGLLAQASGLPIRRQANSGWRIIEFSLGEPLLRAAHPKKSLYSYGDSAGLAPDFPFNPDYNIGDRFRGKCAIF
jgi:hypothetical protein